MLDAKWLELLKATGWQSTALAVASGLFLWLIVPPDYVVIRLMAWAVFLLSGCLAGASLFAGIDQVFSVQKRIIALLRKREAKHDVESYIPFMTKQERDIIRYLLAKNEKTFTAEMGGGYARTLIGRGIVVLAAAPGMPFEPTDVPMKIPDHVWEVLSRNRDQFPPLERGEGDRHPWRVPWQL